MRTPQSAPECTAAAESETATRSEPPPGDCTRTRATPCRPSAWPAERMKPITPQRHATSSNPPRNPSGTRGSNNSRATATHAALIAMLIMLQPEHTITAHSAQHPPAVTASKHITQAWATPETDPASIRQPPQHTELPPPADVPPRVPTARHHTQPHNSAPPATHPATSMNTYGTRNSTCTRGPNTALTEIESTKAMSMNPQAPLPSHYTTCLLHCAHCLTFGGVSLPTERRKVLTKLKTIEDNCSPLKSIEDNCIPYHLIPYHTIPQHNHATRTAPHHTIQKQVRHDAQHTDQPHANTRTNRLRPPIYRRRCELPIVPQLLCWVV